MTMIVGLSKVWYVSRGFFQIPYRCHPDGRVARGEAERRDLSDGISAANLEDCYKLLFSQLGFVSIGLHIPSALLLSIWR